MAYGTLVIVTVAPGQSYTHLSALPLGTRVFISPNPPGDPPGLIVGYANVVVGALITPSGNVGGIAKSYPIFPAGCFVPSQNDLSSFSGWFINVYAVKRRNAITRTFTIRTE